MTGCARRLLSMHAAPGGSPRDSASSTSSTSGAKTNTAAQHRTKPAGPKRVRNGIKLSSNGPITEHSIAQRWFELVERTFSGQTIDLGMEYARQGQTIALDVEPGRIIAEVQGRKSKPNQITIDLATIDEPAWQRAITAMAEEAVYAAKLLAREFPSDLDALFNGINLELLPVNDDTMHPHCSCGYTGACKHAAAVALLITERLSADPLLLFTLRGQPTGRLLERLQQARAMHTHGVAAAHADPHIPGSQQVAPPLESQLDSYWRCGRELSDIREAPPGSHMPHALLRRLGPSPMKGRFPMAGLLASIYDAVSEEAKRLRDQSPENDRQSEEDAPPNVNSPEDE